MSLACQGHVWDIVPSLSSACPQPVLSLSPACPLLLPSLSPACPLPGQPGDKVGVIVAAAPGRGQGQLWPGQLSPAAGGGPGRKAGPRSSQVAAGAPRSLPEEQRHGLRSTAGMLSSPRSERDAALQPGAAASAPGCQPCPRPVMCYFLPCDRTSHSHPPT
jgi:hypothetical protein